MLPPLTWLRSFERAGRTLSFTAAARELGLTQAAISQHVRLLEAQLNVSLFRRLRRGVELTGEGAAYLPHVQAALGALARSTEALFGPDTDETIAICGPISFMALWLAPKLDLFRAAFPHVRLALSTMQVPADYAAVATDFDIRFGVGTFPGRIGHRLSTERLAPMAAPRLLERLDDADGWTGLPLLSVAGAREMWPDWFAAASLPVSAKPVLRCDSFVLAYEAARHGAGVLLASRPLADAALHDGTLRGLSDIELAGDAGHFITTPAGRSLDARRREILAWMLDQARAG